MKLTTAVFKAAGTAAAINALIFFIGKASGIFSNSVIIPNANAPLTLVPVLISSIVPVVLAGLVYYLLRRFSKKPAFIFNIVALVLLLLSFASPFSIPGVPVSMALLLNVMHVVVGLSVIFFFETGLLRRAPARV